MTRGQLAAELVDEVFALSAGQVTAPLELGESGHYFIKVEEKTSRPLDADQVRDARVQAFDTWYEPKKTQAKTDAVIVIPGEDPPVPEELLPGDEEGP